MDRRLFLTGIAAASCASEVSAQRQRLRGRVGRAYDGRTGKLIYQERHTETLTGYDIVADEVRYLDAAGEQFATKSVRFAPASYLPEFVLDNARTGHLEGVKRTAPDTIEVQYREQASEQARRARLPAPGNAIADAGFDRFIEAQWGALMAGERPVRPFLVPSRLDYMDFRIRRDGNGDARRVRFALEIDSALLRLMVPTIKLSYDRQTRRLLRYDGPSNLRDDNGDNYSVRIEFTGDA